MSLTVCNNCGEPLLRYNGELHICRPKAVKPPLGVTPKDIWDLKRCEELRRAIKEYLEAGMEVHTVWLIEYNELVKKGVLKP